jgi:hypothetical protein
MRHGSGRFSAGAVASGCELLMAGERNIDEWE